MPPLHSVCQMCLAFYICWEDFSLLKLLAFHTYIYPNLISGCNKQSLGREESRKFINQFLRENYICCQACLFKLGVFKAGHCGHLSYCTLIWGLRGSPVSHVFNTHSCMPCSCSVLGCLVLVDHFESTEQLEKTLENFSKVEHKNETLGFFML